MAAVYQSIGRPVFTSDHSTEASDNQDISYINSALQTATNNTNALKAKDHLTMLPGATWSHSVSSANSEYTAMQQYVTDSQTFLSDYQTLTTYAQQSNRIAKSQLPALLDDFNAFQGSTSSKPAFVAILQKTTARLQSISTQVKALNPSQDVQQYNSDLLNDLSGMNDGLQNLSDALNGNTSVNSLSAAGEFQTSITNFSRLITTNPTAHIQTSSTIHNQITTLQSEHPLQ